MIVLETAQSKAQFHLKSAELYSLIDKKSNTEFMWDGNPAFWNKHSPILFPIVGALKNGLYQFNGEKYELGRHGFARDCEFEIAQQSDDFVSFVLQSNTETLKVYPFKFKLTINYLLTENSLKVEYFVENIDSQKMYFSIGAHPAFKVPIHPELAFEDYCLLFDLKMASDETNIPIYPLDEAGLLAMEGMSYLEDPYSVIGLDKSIFEKDALIFKNIKSGRLTIFSPKDTHSVAVSYEGFPYLGVWSKYGADFVCIEPWNGITDTVMANGHLEDKLGILSLEAQKVWKGHWMIHFE